MAIFNSYFDTSRGYTMSWQFCSASGAVINTSSRSIGSNLQRVHCVHRSPLNSLEVMEEEVSINRDTPKWMIYMENPSLNG